MKSRPPIPRVVGIATTLFGSWLLLSGKIDAMHVGVGVAASLTIAYFVAHWGTSRPAIYPRIAWFALWLFYQVVLSNLRVARLAFAPGNKLRPRLVTLPPGTHGDVPLALLGCAITLTPGTMSVDISEEKLTVHALDDVSARSVEDGDMARRVHRLFQEQER